MNKKKQIKLEKEKKAKKKKLRDISIGVVGSIIGILALFQIWMIFTFMNAHSGHSQIVLGKNVVTSEVCNEWFNLTTEEQNQLEHFTYAYYEGVTEKHAPIPKDIVIDVCNKWKKVKEEIDSEEKQNE